MAFKSFVLVCGGMGCEGTRSDAVYRGLLLECEEKGLKAKADVELCERYIREINE